MIPTNLILDTEKSGLSMRKRPIYVPMLLGSSYSQPIVFKASRRVFLDVDRQITPPKFWSEVPSLDPLGVCATAVLPDRRLCYMLASHYVGSSPFSGSWLHALTIHICQRVNNPRICPPSGVT